MNKIIVASFLVAIALVWCNAQDYDEFDRLDIDEIMASERLVSNYINCAKTGKKCTPEGQKLRDLVPNALKEKCAKCSEAQKDKVFRILEWIIQNKPEDFLELEDIYDKDHKYRVAYADELKSRNIILPPLK